MKRSEFVTKDVYNNGKIYCQYITTKKDNKKFEFKYYEPIREKWITKVIYSDCYKNALNKYEKILG